MLGLVLQYVVLVVLICFGLTLMEIGTIRHGIEKRIIKSTSFEQLVTHSRSPFAKIHLTFAEYAALDVTWGSIIQRFAPIIIIIIPYAWLLKALFSSDTIEVKLLQLLVFIVSTYLIVMSLLFVYRLNSVERDILR